MHWLSSPVFSSGMCGQRRFELTCASAQFDHSSLYMWGNFASFAIQTAAGLGGSVGCAVRLETRRSRVQPPPRSATFFRGDWSWNIFYGHSLPSADSRRAVSGGRMCTILVNRLEDLACLVNVWLGKLTALNMTPLSWLGRKTSTQTNYPNCALSDCVSAQFDQNLCLALTCEDTLSGSFIYLFFFFFFFFFGVLFPTILTHQH